MCKDIGMLDSPQFDMGGFQKPLIRSRDRSPAEKDADAILELTEGGTRVGSVEADEDWGPIQDTNYLYCQEDQILERPSHAGAHQSANLMRTGASRTNLYNTNYSGNFARPQTGMLRAHAHTTGSWNYQNQGYNNFRFSPMQAPPDEPPAFVKPPVKNSRPWSARDQLSGASNGSAKFYRIARNNAYMEKHVPDSVGINTDISGRLDMIKSQTIKNIKSIKHGFQNIANQNNFAFSH